MKIQTYLERINLLHKLIASEKTGVPEELAGKLGLSKSRLYSILEDLKLREAPIGYCRKRKSYYYREPFEMKAFLELKYLDRDDIIRINGGSTFFKDSTEAALSNCLLLVRESNSCSI